MVDGGFRQGVCQLVAQAQGYQLECIWGSLAKFQIVLFVLDYSFSEISTWAYLCFPGLGVSFKLRGDGLKFDVLPPLDVVCL